MAAVLQARFVLFGAQHLVILAVFVGGCALMWWSGRRLGPIARRRLVRAFGALTLLVCGPFEVVDWIHGIAHWRTSLPLQICDVAWLVAGVALLTRSRRWTAILYYWGLTLSLQGVLTPDLDQAFPDVQFFGYWVRHLVPVWAAVYLVGARIGPTWRDYRFALMVTSVWAAGMIALNRALGSNYGYLNAKPVSHSLLDLLGPWPWYVVVEVALVAAGWALITWPWNRRTKTDPSA
ncbi:YwaF family protein [Nocardioides terrisoli]|uniref:YwaF family protein n=1 Tax=Nocardioides terrisoli TaxID=3388267 RepID=UPI00287B778C|nr:TIGR02206 family membrane protein [Nocardioides marmorisolisilvae]